MMVDPSHELYFGDAIGPWHDYFAWFPTRTYDGRLAWLTTIRRRRIQKHWYLHGGPSFWWEYHMDGK